jgi:hypothetical protein
MKLMTYRVGIRKRVAKLPYGKPKPKKLSRERVYQLVREIILAKKVRAEGRSVVYGHYWGLGQFTAEELAGELNVEIHKVILALQQLNMMGLVRQKERSFAHDTNRNGMFFGRDSGWSANTYSIILKSEYNLPREVSPTKPENGPEGTILVWDHQKPKKKARYSKRLGVRVGE